MELFKNRVVAASGLVLEIAGLLAALDKATDKLQFLDKLPEGARLPLIIGLLALGALLIAPSLIPRVSRVRNGVRVRDDFSGGAAVVGRDPDIRGLVDAVTNHQLTFLIGDSGVGKSTIVNAGVIAALAKEGSAVGLTFHQWGFDWAMDPMRGLRALVSRLPGIEPQVAPKDHGKTELVEFVRSVAQQLKRPLVVFFDQFDDYQILHASKLHPNSNEVLTVDQLTASNEFWAAIRDLVVERVIHAVFITRTDSQTSLESVRFCEPKLYRLVRLNESAAASGFDSLFVDAQGSQVSVADPQDATWPALRQRILDDLIEAGNGGALPAQMTLAARGLTRLGSLTRRSYDAGGGLGGLETRYFRAELRSILANSSFDDLAILLEVMRAMVQTEGSRYKASPATKAEIAARLEAAYRNANRNPPSNVDAALDNLLSALTDAKLVRKQLDGAAWILYHDYLARTVVSLQKSINEMTLLLDDYGKRFAETPLWRRVWPEIPARILIGMVFAWLAGLRHKRFTFKPHHLFAFCAYGSRIVVLLIVSTAIGLAAIYARMANDTRSLREQFVGNDGFPSPAEVESLWDLSSRSSGVRLSVMEEILVSPTSSAKLVTALPMITHAAVGLRTGDRAKLQQLLLKRCMNVTAPPTALACLEIAEQLAPLQANIVPIVVPNILRLLGAAEADLPKRIEFVGFVRRKATGLRLRSALGATAKASCEQITAFIKDPQTRPNGRVSAAVELWLTLPCELPEQQLVALEKTPEAFSSLDRMWQIAIANPEPSDKFVAEVIRRLVSLEVSAMFSPAARDIRADPSSDPDDPDEEVPEPAAPEAAALPDDPAYPPPLDPTEEVPQENEDPAELATIAKIASRLAAEIVKMTDLPLRASAAAALEQMLPATGAEAALAQVRGIIAEFLESTSVSKAPTSRTTSTNEIGRLTRLLEDKSLDATKRASLGHVLDVYKLLKAKPKTREEAQNVVRILRQNDEIAFIVACEVKRIDAVLKQLSPVDTAWLSDRVETCKKINSSRSERPQKPVRSAEDQLNDLIKQAEEGASVSAPELDGSLSEKAARTYGSRLIALSRRCPHVHIAHGLADVFAVLLEQQPKLTDDLVRLGQEQELSPPAAVFLLDAQARLAAGDMVDANLVAKNLVRRLFTAQPGDLSIYAEALGAFSARTPAARGGDVAAAILAGMESTKDQSKFEALRRALRPLVGALDAAQRAQVVHLLKWPTCIATCSADLVSAITTSASLPKAYTVWDIAEWAQGQKVEVDLAPKVKEVGAVPKPIAPHTSASAPPTPSAR